jgi:hypothetical protein
LLLESNPTDVCLRCHATAHGNSWGADVLAPGPQYGGGQFVFLLEDNLNDGPGGDDPANWIRGHEAGHNVISTVRGTVADSFHAVSPGGSYPSENLHCTSCHDPHGRGGHFRLLYGSDFPDATVNGRVFLYTFPAPVAEGIDVDGPPETDDHHTAYRSGMHEWCANCHGDYHEGLGGGGSVTDPTLETPGGADPGVGSVPLPTGGTFGAALPDHPSNLTMNTDLIDTYNRYRGTGFLDGDGTDAYIAAVPIEFPAATTGFRGPAPVDARVTCVSCHRAHASSGPGSGRWDFNITTWAEEGIVSGSYPIPNPYEATAGPLQETLCQKCHGTDVPN